MRGRQQIKNEFQYVKVNPLRFISLFPRHLSHLPSQGHGWRLRIGGEQEQIACQHCFVARMQADASLGSWLGSPHFFGEVFAGGAVQEHSQLNGNGFVRAGVSFITRPSPQFSLRGNYEIRRPFQTELASYAVSSLEGRLSLAKDYDLRVRWDKDQTTRVHIGIGYYW